MTQARLASARRFGAFSLRTKTVVLLVLVAALPASAVALLLAGVSHDAVETSERQLQAAVIAEVSGTTQRALDSIRADAEAVANALSFAAREPGESALGAVRSLLATRRSIDAVRFEVPSASVSTVILREGRAEVPVPSSTVEQREKADTAGIGFALNGDGSATLVVPVPASSREAPRGYVTVIADLGSIEQQLARASATRFTGSGARLVVADAARRAVAVHGIPGLKRGQSVSSLAIWQALPDGLTRAAHVGVVTSHVEAGVPMLGALETVGDLGWSIAIFRPESEAYRALDTLRQRTIAVVVGAALLALALGLLVAGKITSPVLAIAEGARRIGQRRWQEVKLEVERSDELGELATSVQRMAIDLRESELEIAHQAKVRGDLSRYMSRDLVDAIVRGDHSLELGGRRAEVSILFADVVAFTPLAESHPAEVVVSLLNELFSMLTEIVFRHGGTVDKFIGDCIMAIWGAPVAQSDHAQRALAAGEDMLRFLETANEGFREKYGVEIRLGIGINSGEAIVGNIGSDKRMEYTVIGDVVNVAARLESIAAPNQLLVAAETRRLVGDDFELTSLGEKNLTGRRSTTGVYQLETKS